MSKRPGDAFAIPIDAKKPKTAIPSSAETTAMIAQKRAEIAERIARLKQNKAATSQLASSSTTASVPTSARPPKNDDESIQRKRITDEFARRHNKVAVFQNQAAGDALDNADAKRGLQMDVHPSLMMDADGAGNIGIRRHNAPLAAQTTVKKPVKAQLPTEEPVLALVNTKHFDKNLAGGKWADGSTGHSRSAPRTALRFAAPGKFVDKAIKLRQDAKMEQVRKSIAERMQKSGLDEELDMVGDGAVIHDAVPDVEWWDMNFLPNKSYADLARGCLHLKNTVSTLVQHPVPKEPVFEAPVKTTNVYLTTRERKKMRRLRRLEEQKERQEKIRLGLMEVDKPKVKISNMMKVMGTEAVQDPTLVELGVRQQMNERVEKHERENAARKLTDEQRSAKNFQKHVEDTHLKTSVAVFKVRRVSHPSHRFKIDTNAQQLHLTGICIVHGKRNLIIVEGGPRGVQKYKRLMLERIDWAEIAADDTEALEDTTENSCVLLWEGLKGDADFKGFRFKQCPTEQKVLECLGPICQTYWDLAKSFKSIT